MAWRVAKSLLTLREQVDAMAPNRNKSSDGTIGDQSHQSRNSDHNPNADGVVTAMDITNDPAHGVNARGIAEMLLLSRDPRIKYVISNQQIFSSPAFSTSKPAWQWRHYSGANAHTQHVHISVLGDEALYDDTREWPIEMVSKVEPPLQSPGSSRCMNITATMFGGAGDFNKSAYDEHVITDSELGVALPSRLSVRPLPKVRVFNSATQASVVCGIVDVGPWNIDDPYWETGARPQAESGVDHRGRPTNHAGIDLTPAAARTIGIPGKGQVDWEFVGAEITKPEEGPMGTSVSDIIALLEKVLPLIQAIQKQQGTAPGQTTTTSSLTQPDDLKKVLDIIMTVAGGTKEQPLGQVNGALGETIGNLLNGKKTAIGTIGALVTSLLSFATTAAPGAATGAASAASSLSGLGQVLAPLIPAAGLSGFAMPIFLALAGWGVLGKMEKWSQGTAPPPK